VSEKVGLENEWMAYTYHQVNDLLECSHLLSGAQGWVIAKRAGKRYAAEKFQEDTFLTRDEGKLGEPSSAPPGELIPVLETLDAALDELLGNHMGWVSLLNSASRHYRKLYQDRARKLDSMVNRGLQLAH